jgi:hypothetical protein
VTSPPVCASSSIWARHPVDASKCPAARDCFPSHSAVAWCMIAARNMAKALTTDTIAPKLTVPERVTVLSRLRYRLGEGRHVPRHCPTLRQEPGGPRFTRHTSRRQPARHGPELLRHGPARGDRIHTGRHRTTGPHSGSSDGGTASMTPRATARRWRACCPGSLAARPGIVVVCSCRGGHRVGRAVGRLPGLAAFMPPDTELWRR